MLGICDLLFNSTEDQDITLSLRNDFGLWNRVETVIDYGDSSSWTECILHYAMATSLWGGGQRVGQGVLNRNFGRIRRYITLLEEGHWGWALI